MKKMKSATRSGTVYSGQALTQIAMPMGGIGSGSICMNGIGGTHDFAIRNLPATSAMPDGHAFTDAAFALLRVEGRKSITLLVEGQLPTAWIYDRGLQAQGYRKGGQDGLPRFRNANFRSDFPFGHVELTDDDVPLRVTLTGWSPLIPLDDRNSSFPCAILDYRIQNPSRKPVTFEFSYHVSHWAVGEGGDEGTRTRLIPNGVMLFNTDNASGEKFGSASVSLIGHAPKIKASWFRGGWFDAISVLWRECSEGRFLPTPPTTADKIGRNGASILVRHTLKPGESIDLPVVLTWHFPNVYYSAGEAKELIQLGRKTRPDWSPWYATQWPDAAAVAADIHQNYASLRARTAAFKAALDSTTLPPVAIDAVASNLAILKSPTILRQANGNVWAWEGCFTGIGCCHGSCTHVWNYAQALPHLFPNLERTLREQELERSMDDIGHVNFRAALPDNPTDHTYHAAADGQLGGIMKVWRDWQISGDHAWLARLYPLAKRSLRFAIDHWDPQHKGLLAEPHHNTYDIEFWGADGMCTSIYLGALRAMVQLAQASGDAEFSAECAALADRGSTAADRQLYNGDYYLQKVQWADLKDQSFAKRLQDGDPNDLDLQPLREEGPKYQYADGCLADGVIGAWMSELYGLPSSLKPDFVLKHLLSVFKFNFKKSLIRHPNAQRAGYAIGDEAGLLLCTWPKGKALTLPFPYADEVWTGVEYQVASHLLLRGRTAEAMTIVKAVRARYDGITRNPFNEYECGNYYARALSSFALLQSFSGVRYSAVDRVLHVRGNGGSPVRTVLSTASGYGTVTVTRQSVSIQMIEGSLDVVAVQVADGKRSYGIASAQKAMVGATITCALKPPKSKKAISERSV